MAKQVTCSICGAVFTTRRPNRKYCSLNCKAAGDKLRRMKWNDENPGYINEYMRIYRKNKRESKAVVTG